MPHSNYWLAHIFPENEHIKGLFLVPLFIFYRILLLCPQFYNLLLSSASASASTSASVSATCVGFDFFTD